ncbi:MAG: DedA family protein [Nitrospirae bacterium]|nr:DedA family protein [Nitrospirota bacterium]
MASYLSYLVAQFPYMGLFALLILGGVGLPFPEDATLILCGFLISEELVRPLPALLVVYAGLLITDFFIFLVGNKYGHAVVNHPVFRKIISERSLAAVERKFADKGVMLIIIGRHLIGLRAQIFLTAGVMKMSPLKFLGADAFSSLITMSLMIGAGYAGGNSLEIIRRGVSKAQHLAVVLLIVSLVAFLIYRYCKTVGKK